ncbi:Uma2 family endonuclease [Paenibacillus humicus]|uniref:Uma2 family endonuclease n=1 Tax=Paenibacillus humicus TaxID=412861 RepID=UPI003D2881F3
MELIFCSPISFSSATRTFILSRTESAPDLLIEILSPSSGAIGKVKKKAVYEQFRVREYWFVEPHYVTVDQFLLVDGKYQLAATNYSSWRIESPQLACLSVELSKMFQAANRFEG